MSADNNLGAASGGLAFNGGTLQFGSAFNFANTRTITLNGGGGTLDTNGFNTIVSQGITGAGGLTKTGAGTLTLSGSDSYSGGTVLNAGILVVNNAQALGFGDVTVNSGVLEGDPQPINVKGDYTQNAAGTLLLQVAGAGSGHYDFLNVSGNANLGGTLQLTNLGYAPKAGDQLTLVTTGGSITSRFARWVNPFTTGPGINTIDLIYSKNSVVLEFLNLITPPVPPVGPTPPPVVITTVDFASFALTPNQRAAANLLDDVQLDSRASNLMSFLYKEPFSATTQAGADFREMPTPVLLVIPGLSVQFFTNTNRGVTPAMRRFDFCGVILYWLHVPSVLLNEDYRKSTLEIYTLTWSRFLFKPVFCSIAPHYLRFVLCLCGLS